MDYHIIRYFPQMWCQLHRDTRKQPRRTGLLLILLCSTILFFLFSGSTQHTTRPGPALLPSTYTHRGIKDFKSPEYTAPGDTGSVGDTGSNGYPGPAQGTGSASDTVIAGGFAGLVADTGIIADTGSVGDTGSEGDRIPNQESLSRTEKDVQPDSDLGIGPSGLSDVAPDNVPVNKPDGDSPKEEQPNQKPEEQNEDPSQGSPGLLTTVRQVALTTIMDTIIKRQREIIAKEMEGYSFHRKLKARSAAHLIPDQGGRPVRSLVVTTWRSGSTFIGDILNSHPGSYYHYEPLLDFDIVQVRSGSDAAQAQHNLRHLLSCNYTDMDHYLNYAPEHPWLISHNAPLWKYCQTWPEICLMPEFLSPFCSLFPFQSLKTVRLRLNLTKEFLEDKKLGVQVLLLVRDPRGTIQSRKHRDWCPGNPDCDDPARLCQDLVSDYNTAIAFRRKFPHSFKVVRYEDLSFDAYNMTKELFDFFHLNYHPRVQMFLDTHTKQTIGGVSSTFRDSKTAPIHWRSDLNWDEVEKIQKVCKKALKLWGYELGKDKDHVRTFDPVGIFKFI